jgi:hypothetical protein
MTMLLHGMARPFQRLPELAYRLRIIGDELKLQKEKAAAVLNYRGGQNSLREIVIPN